MKILICDDSSVARRSIAKCITQTDSVEIVFAKDGLEALQVLKEQNIDILFLDLTMPVMDGFEVLASLPVSNYQTKTVVISGDVQQEAKTRCRNLGAYDFVSKPFTAEMAEPLFNDLGIIFHTANKPKPVKEVESIDPLAKFKELTNIALGQGAAVLGDHLSEFIQLPIPNVGPLTYGELKMTMEDVITRENSVAVSQRFVGGGLHGEALVCLRGAHVNEIGIRLGYTPEHSTYNEIVLNIANLLVSSYLVALGEQLAKRVALRQPTVLGHIQKTQSSISDSEEIFTIEYTYSAETLDFQCEVLFLLDNKSVAEIYKLMEMM